MSELEEQKRENDLEQIVRQVIKKQLLNVSDNRQAQDHSFAFLEKSTLHLLLDYLLSTDKSISEENVNRQLELSIVKQLDDMQKSDKVQFENIIESLKKLS